MAKNEVKLEFSGESMEEVIGKIIQFLSMIKGIGFGTKEVPQGEPGGKDRVPERPAE